MTKQEGDPHGDIIVSKLEIQSLCSIHFQTYTLGKGMNSIIPLSYRLNITTNVLLQGWLKY